MEFLVRCYAKTLAAQNINVNCVIPGTEALPSRWQQRHPLVHIVTLQRSAALSPKLAVLTASDTCLISWALLRALVKGRDTREC